jgi:glycosyltransferase involved in cell wall biosynthesis
MIKVVHLIMFFGHPNQPYTKNLIERLSKKIEKVEHEVICSKVLSTSSFIKTHVLNTKKNLLNIKVLFFVLKRLFFDKHFQIVLPQSSLKTKFHFFLRWEPLLNQSVDIVHVHHLHVVPNALIHYLKLKQIKLVVSLRGRELVSNTVLKEQQIAFLNKVSYFNVVHVISDYMFQLALSKGVEQYKLIRIYRGFDFNLLKPKNIKLNFEVNTMNTIKALCVGRLAWEKGQFYILDSIYRLKNKGVFVSLDIYGEGGFREFLEYRIQQLGLEKQVVLRGHISHILLKTYYKNYDIAIQPSLYEALSNGLLDLTFHNLPSVISNQGGMIEIIRNGVNGVIFDINEPTQLDEAILACLDIDMEALKKFNNKLNERFSIDVEVDSFHDLYKELC